MEGMKSALFHAVCAVCPVPNPDRMMHSYLGVAFLMLCTGTLWVINGHSPFGILPLCVPTTRPRVLYPHHVPCSFAMRLHRARTPHFTLQSEVSIAVRPDPNSRARSKCQLPIWCVLYMLSTCEGWSGNRAVLRHILMIDWWLISLEGEEMKLRLFCMCTLFNLLSISHDACLIIAVFVL